MTLDFSNIEAEVALQRETASAKHKIDALSFLEFYLTSKSDLIQKTSGSTGKPKEIRLGRNILISSAEATLDFFNLKKGDRALLCIPAEFIGGKMMLVRSAERRLILDVIEPQLKLQIPEKTYEFSAMIPAQVEHLLEQDLAALLRIKNLIIGGAPVSAELEQVIISSGINAYSTYGMTETASHVALKKLDGKSNFKALNGISFSLDSNQSLVISGTRIPGSPLHTNDIANLISEHEFKWLGRLDNVINSGGVKIPSEELEHMISFILDVPFYIKKTAHPIYGETPLLVLESDAISDLDKSMLLDEIKNAVPKHWCPTDVEFYSQFEYTKSGKIKRI